MGFETQIRIECNFGGKKFVFFTEFTLVKKIMSWLAFIPTAATCLTLFGMFPAVVISLGITDGQTKAQIASTILCAQLATIVQVFSNYNNKQDEIQNTETWKSIFVNLTYLTIPKFIYGAIVWKALHIIENQRIPMIE